MLTIALPIPKANDPNARRHWGDKRRLVKSEREGAWAAARQALGHGPSPKWTEGKVLVVWTAKNKRGIIDPDNCVSRCKPLIDGLVDAGVFVTDKHVTVEIVPPEVGPTPGVVLHCKPKEPA